MAKKNQSKRSKSGNKTPSQSRPASPDHDVDEEDVHDDETGQGEKEEPMTIPLPAPGTLEHPAVIVQIPGTPRAEETTLDGSEQEDIIPESPITPLPHSEGREDPFIPQPQRNGGHTDDKETISRLEAELEQTSREKEHMSNQYRTLLGKLQAMRNSLGEKLKEDAEELDRRESQITTLTQELSTTQSTLTDLQTELDSLSTENTTLSTELSQLRVRDSLESNDNLHLTRELRELRGDLERLRMEREEWEMEAEREKKRAESIESEVRALERNLADQDARRSQAEDGWKKEERRARDLEEVLGEFQAAKDLEISQATNELEAQLRYAASSLAKYKSRTADAEHRVSALQHDASKTSKLEKELKEKTAMVGKLRHDSVVTQEHLTEALRRLRRNTSETNVDRRLVTNILLQFLTTARADAKRFEMLSLLATILSWEDGEREKAGLQRTGGGGGPSKLRRKASEMNVAAEKTSKMNKGETEPDPYNESFSNLFVEFLLKEAAQGQKTDTRDPSNQISPPLMSPAQSTTGRFGSFTSRHRTLSNTSLNSTTFGGGGNLGGLASPTYLAGTGRSNSGSVYGGGGGGGGSFSSASGAGGGNGMLTMNGLGPSDGSNTTLGLLNLPTPQSEAPGGSRR